jgi:hypothetical protein
VSPLKPEQQKAVVDICAQRLLTSYGLRSLALGEPGYQGRYGGPQRDRDAAYHQGTVWPWLIGPYIDAFFSVNGQSDESKAKAREILRPLAELDVMGILNARVVSFGRYGRTKKIRLGISPRVITDTYAEDNLAGRLFGYVPKSLQKHQSTPD